MILSLRGIINFTPILALLCMVVAGCSTVPKEVPPLPPTAPPTVPTGKVKIGKPYTIFGETYYPIDSAENYQEEGIASWYGAQFHGALTANGELFDMYTVSAAHKTLPLPTLVRVTNLENGLSDDIRINDRGPFVKGRLIDLSYAASKKLGFMEKGTARVRVEALTTEYAKQQLNQMAKELENKEVQVAQREVKLKLESRVTAPVKKVNIQEDEKGYFVQVGAFGTRSNAEKFAQKLQSAGRASVRANTSDKDNLFKVLMGPFASPFGADAMVARLSQMGLKQFRVFLE